MHFKKALYGNENFVILSWHFFYAFHRYLFPHSMTDTKSIEHYKQGWKNSIFLDKILMVKTDIIRGKNPAVFSVKTKYKIFYRYLSNEKSIF